MSKNFLLKLTGVSKSFRGLENPILDKIDFLNNNSNEVIPKYSNALLVDSLVLNYNQNSIILMSIL